MKSFVVVLIALTTLGFCTQAQTPKQEPPGAPTAPSVQAVAPLSAPSGSRPPEMVWLRGCTFRMGREIQPSKDSKPLYVEDPAHEVQVDGFYLDRYEVTNGQYFQFCMATNHSLPFLWGNGQFHCGLDFPNHPVVGISQEDASDYARWRGCRLPTEAEWEYAARGGQEGKKYPNGDEADAKLYNFGQSHMGTMPVGSFPANGFGLFDMSGNVSEWVADWYDGDYYRHCPMNHPSGPETGRFRVFRGGSWISGPMCGTVYRRNALPGNWVDFGVGFRCARSGPPPDAPPQ